MTNQDIANKWIDFAETDLKSAKIIFNSNKADKRQYRLVVWLCHQSIEKILKGLLIVKNKKLVLIHDLIRLGELTQIDLSSNEIDFLRDLNVYYISPRYPDLSYSKSSPEVNKKIAEFYICESKKLFKCLKQHIQKKL